MRATFKLRVFDYLAKPFSLAQLRQTLGNAIEKFSLGRTAQDRLRERLGHKIKLLRVEHDWSLKDLAAMTRLSVSQISSIERGANLPSIESLLSICHAFGSETFGALIVDRFLIGYFGEIVHYGLCSQIQMTRFRYIPLFLCLVLRLVFAKPAETQTLPPNSQFPHPEKLTYNVEWRLVNAGTATVQLLRMYGSKKWNFNVNIESSGLVSRLYRVADSYKVAALEPFCLVSSSLGCTGRQETHQINFGSGQLSQ